MKIVQENVNYRSSFWFLDRKSLKIKRIDVHRNFWHPTDIWYLSRITLDLIIMTGGNYELWEWVNVTTFGCRYLQILLFPAYSSWSRFYNTYPTKLRSIFNFKNVNLGHYVTSFALKETPSAVAKIVRGQLTTAEPRRLNKKLATHHGWVKRIV